MNRKLVALTIIGAVLVLAGCSSTSTKATPTASPSETNPYGAGFTVDPPKANDVVLTVSGAKTVDYTMSQLKNLATVKIDIMEPFAKKRQSFDGVEMKNLFDASGITVGEKVNTIALNEYEYADTVANFENNHAIIAVSRDGKDIPMDQGGPIRIVFNSDSKYFTFLDAWNWSLRTIKLTSK
jgi:hypothetical protein